MPNGMSKYRAGAQAARNADQNKETFAPIPDSSVQGPLPAAPVVYATPSMPQGYKSPYNDNGGALAPDWATTLRNKGQIGPQVPIDDPRLRNIEAMRANSTQAMNALGPIFNSQTAQTNQQYNDALTKIQQAAAEHAKGNEARRQMFLTAIQNLIGGARQAQPDASASQMMTDNGPAYATASAFGRYR